MKRNDVLRILTEHREALQQQFGVKSLALFGSVVRDEATEASDVDLVLRHAVIEELQEDIYGEAVDVIQAQKVEVSRATHAGSD